MKIYIISPNSKGRGMNYTHVSYRWLLLTIHLTWKMKNIFWLLDVSLSLFLLKLKGLTSIEFFYSFRSFSFTTIIVNLRNSTHKFLNSGYNSFRKPPSFSTARRMACPSQNIFVETDTRWNCEEIIRRTSCCPGYDATY